MIAVVARMIGVAEVCVVATVIILGTEIITIAIVVVMVVVAIIAAIVVAIVSIRGSSRSSRSE
eukprot:974221-Pyramimonas_sp.AAC.1